MGSSSRFCPEADDGVLHALERAREPDAESQRQHHGQHTRGHHFAHQPAACVLDALGECVVLHLDEQLGLLREVGVERVELAELHGHRAFAGEGAVGAAAHQAFDHAQLHAPHLDARGQQAVLLQPFEHLVRFARGFVEAAAQHRVVEHQRLAPGAFHGRAAFGQRLGRARKPQRARRGVAALGHERVVLEHRAQRHANQQRGDQQKGKEQELLERAPYRRSLRHQWASATAGCCSAGDDSRVTTSPRSV
jgi:hypothetical protein